MDRFATSIAPRQAGNDQRDGGKADKHPVPAHR
jgi:hypothetical protein